METRINVVCTNENCVVGTLPAEPLTLSRKVVWGRFVPISAEYQLQATEGRDGDYLRCARCGANLAIEGAAVAAAKPATRSATPPPTAIKTRAQIQAEALAVQTDRHVVNTGPMPAFIVLGHSRLEVRP